MDRSIPARQRLIGVIITTTHRRPIARRTQETLGRYLNLLTRHSSQYYFIPGTPSTSWQRQTSCFRWVGKNSGWLQDDRLQPIIEPGARFMKAFTDENAESSLALRE